MEETKVGGFLKNLHLCMK